jgi:hypothetical protein
MAPVSDQDQDISGWLPLPQAAAAYGWNGRTVRRKIAAGELAARLVPGKFGPEWRVQPPPGYTPPGPAPPADNPAPAPAPPGQDMIALHSLERLLAPLAEERARLQGELEAARDEIADLQAARLVDREEIGRLRGLLEAAPAPKKWRWPWQR